MKNISFILFILLVCSFSKKEKAGAFDSKTIEKSMVLIPVPVICCSMTDSHPARLGHFKKT